MAKPKPEVGLGLYYCPILVLGKLGFQGIREKKVCENHTSAWNLKFLWSSAVPMSHKTGRPLPAKQWQRQQSRVVRLPWLPGKPRQVTVSLVSRRDLCRVVYTDMHVKLCRWLDAKEDWLVGVAWSGEVEKSEADDLGVLIQRNQKKFLVIWSCNTPLFLCTGFLGTNCPRIG